MNKATVQTFFETRGFNFEQDFEAIQIQVPDNEALSKNLENTLYFYQSKNEQTKTSFYLTIRELNKDETFYIKRYIWNKANTEIYFLSEKKQLQLLITDHPQNTNTIATFKYNEKDEEKLQKINRTEFDRGTFWLNFADFLDKKKKANRVDKKLVETLKKLKEDLLQEYKTLDIQKPKEIVQALIDRTLFIKFLEDNHIINSFFYEKKFQDKDLNYKSILADKDKATINQLFEEINEIFSSHLFETPKIQDWSDKVFFLLKQAISKTEVSGQLSLFDFDFSAIPIEFIANIYEVFFEENLAEGIFYTPPDLAQLIVDETIGNKIGKVLDPACGSGMFLVMAFRKIVENTQKDFNQLSIEEVITYKSELLEQYIFGIEKKEYARRLALFAMYLEILKDINPKELKAYINQKLRNHETISVFDKVGKFHENIIYGNSLETEESEKPHNNQRFDFIVGNPPFFKIKSNQNTERKFVEKFELSNNNETLKAREIIEKYQISQCFMLKVKEWANAKTRLGFVLNYSNFNSEEHNFQKFFFTHYQLEKFYEMSEIKRMLFEKAMESVGVVIFKNQKINQNYVNYLKIEKNSFSDTFKTILIKEENTIQIPQEDILSQKRSLRDYLFANEYDLKLLEKIEKQSYKGLWEFIEWIRENKDECSFLGLDAVKLVGYIELFSQIGILSEYNPKSINPEKILLTSDLIKYYLSIKFSKYQGYDFSTLNREESHKIPIPKNLEEDIVAEITELSQKLSEGVLRYKGDVKKEINELVGDLYKLDFLETTRIQDFSEKPDRKLTEKEIHQIYCETLQDSLRLYTEPKIQVYVGKNLPFNLACVGIYYDTENYPTTEKTLQSIINDLVKDTNSPYQVFYPIQRIYFAKKVIYIIKENKFKNWSETKAFEDAQEILKTSLKK